MTVAHPLGPNLSLPPAFRFRKKQRWLLLFSPREYWALARQSYGCSAAYTREGHIWKHMLKNKSSQVKSIQFLIHANIYNWDY